jgi:plasmid stabilization system protein ParE
LTLPIILWPEAQQEYDDAVDWYESQRSGRGVLFLERIHDTLDQISANPEWYPIVQDDIRRAVVRRYPFIILFRIRPRRIVIVAVFHTSRDPGVWQRRV